jgi:hypothetical protein
VIEEPERRCSNCGALVSADAAWCGQCYEPLPGQGRAARPSSPGTPGAGAGLPGEPTLLAERLAAGEHGERPPQVDPVAAAIRSALVPGLGHWALGRRGDAIARFVLAIWFTGAAVSVLASGSGTAGAAAFAIVFVVAALALWASSALDAYLIASGRSPLVTPRVLLWAIAIVVLAAVLVGTLLIIPSARGG